MNRLFNYFPYRFEEVDPALDRKIFRYSLVFPSLFVILFWLVEIVETLYDLNFVQYGIYPLHAEGLKGILLSPFIHSGYKHLMANTVPFFILSVALFYFYRNLALRIFLLIFLISGLCVWLGGREAYHIGASGLVYGLASFLFFSGIFRNDVRLLTIALIIAMLYGSMIWGALPIVPPDISWESHLWGAISGIVLSLYYRKQGPRHRVIDWGEDDEDNTPENLQEEEANPLNNNQEENH